VRPAPDDARFGPWHAAAAYLAAWIVAVIGASVVLAVTGYIGDPADSYPIWLVAILQVPLWLGLVGGAVFVSRRFGSRDLQKDYRFEFRTVDLAGFPIGVLTQLVFVPALYWLLSPIIDRDKVGEAAESLTDRATSTVGVLLLVVLVVVCAPIVEELFFRGLVMRSIEARWTDGLAIIVSAVLFGLVHFNLYTLPALILFGVILGYLAQRTGRLGMPILAHAGFNATTVALLVWG